MSRFRFALCAVSASLLASAAHAASFDCVKARAVDDRTICADRALNDKDVRMGLLYDLSRHLVAMGRRGMLEDEQIEWLKGRHQCGANKQCLNAAYDHRIARFQGVIDEIAAHGPF